LGFISQSRSSEVIKQKPHIDVQYQLFSFSSTTITCDMYSFALAFFRSQQAKNNSEFGVGKKVCIANDLFKNFLQP